MGGSGRQSLFAPFGVEARYQLSLTGWLVLAAAIILVGVLALSITGIRRKGKPIGHQSGIRMIWWLGAVFPTVTLFALLVVTLPAMRPIVAGVDALKIAVTGEQFWWRVGYAGPQGGVVTANELRVPVGRTVDLRLEAGDVLHSFWVPGLAGKMDMIPGRTNRLVVRATKAGVYRGQCAEFCGLSHALMAFDVVAMEPAAFDAWLAREAAGAAAPVDAAGAAAFARHGCGGCHAVRGTDAAGMIGPDLTHIGARRSLGAGMQPMTIPNLARFVRDAPSVKPGARMPAYPQMTPEEAQAIARYLKGLA
ncbi:cytochrome c oxidase subunit 2 [Sphingomonas jinjuensis]|uniref:Cytochrome aa3 subunit 2 n=1 Tax=Sphingomonas jinjuensis TaxID=535907 RepID=A0A840F822_9SPHN|nr:cytochrome c oxidase subunit II [Sphingomonas jinjuensis]MBB4153879.1 cytochrome c oxidase subunit 2 [Sphingomonas jinjuensis]